MSSCERPKKSQYYYSIFVKMPENDAKRICQRLSEKECLEVISKLSKPVPPSKHSLAQEYRVTEGAVRKVWKQKDEIQQ